MDDAFTINEDTALVIAAGSLTANDTDIDGGALSVTSVQGALNGTVTLAAGTITFTPTANYSGPAAFTYTVSDGNGGSATGTVNITVDPVNDAPVAVDDAFTINEDTALVIAAGSLAANDTDIDGGALSVTSVQGALNGTVTLAGGTITFTPTANSPDRPPSPTPSVTATAAAPPARSTSPSTRSTTPRSRWPTPSRSTRTPRS